MTPGTPFTTPPATPVTPFHITLSTSATSYPLITLQGRQLAHQD